VTDRDWTIAPGETLREWMNENSMAMSPSTVAVMAHLSVSEVEGILRGSRRITARIAAGLERATHIPARFWRNLERAYRSDLAAGRSDMTEAEVDLERERAVADPRADALVRARRAINDLADLGCSCPYESEHELADEIKQRDDLIAALWLYVGRYEVMQLTTEQKDLFADIVDRVYDDNKPVDRWWRNDD
jgi:plasmid maintenance system antidote protein VapI